MQKRRLLKDQFRESDLGQNLSLKKKNNEIEADLLTQHKVFMFLKQEHLTPMFLTLYLINF